MLMRYFNAHLQEYTVAHKTAIRTQILHLDGVLSLNVFKGALA
jgi:hypothetical protein